MHLSEILVPIIIAVAVFVGILVVIITKLFPLIGI